MSMISLFRVFLQLRPLAAGVTIGIASSVCHATSVAVSGGVTGTMATYLRVNTRLVKGETLSDAVRQLLANARENDVLELDPAKKGFIAEVEIRDTGLILDRDLDLTEVCLADAFGQICEATGGAFLLQKKDSEKPRLLFFRNSSGAIRDAAYKLPKDGLRSLWRELKERGIEPGPGECVVVDDGSASVVRAGNRCHAALKDILDARKW